MRLKSRDVLDYTRDVLECVRVLIVTVLSRLGFKKLDPKPKIEDRGGNMKTMDFSAHEDYHTQRNNNRWPHGTCLATSLVMAAKQAGWTVRSETGVQPEDDIAQMCHSEEAHDLIKRNYPWALDNDGNLTIEPHTIHGVAMWAIRRVLARETGDSSGEYCASFRSNVSIDQIVSHIQAGGGVAVSGTFDLDSGDTLNHVVSVAGLVVHSSSSSIAYVIIDDPYGDFHTSYRDERGNGVHMTLEEFIAVFKTRGSKEKWAHLIEPKEECV